MFEDKLNWHSINADLHCHTTASDGELTPSELVNRAIDNKVEILAITDHDTIDGYQQINRETFENIRLVSGIEFSAVWKGIGIHIVGLNFEPALLKGAIQLQKQAREKRSLKIAERLEKKGVNNPLEGALKFASGEVIGRPHFAKYLVAEGYFKTESDAFSKWLGKGKIGDVKTSWPEVETVVKNIKQAKGLAVVAHPQSYNMTNTKLGVFLKRFKEWGGSGLEVSVSGLDSEQRKYYASLCEKYDLQASRGSDFHTPTNQWIELGRVPELPKNVTPIWSAF